MGQAHSGHHHHPHHPKAQDNPVFAETSQGGNPLAAEEPRSEAEHKVTLSDACREGDLETVQRLCQEKPQEQDELFNAFRSVAVRRDPAQRAEIMLWLLQFGGLKPTFARETTYNYSGDVYTPLSCALTTPGSAPVVEYLLDQGISVDAVCNGHRTPLTLAAEESSLEYAELLLGRGTDVNARDERKHTPLFVAKSCEMMQLLVGRGADIQAECGHQSRLNSLLSESHPDRKLLRCLLDLGAKPDGTSMYYAMDSKEHGEALVSLLDDYGANVFDVDLKNVTNKNAREYLYNAQQRLSKCRAACICLIAIRRFRADECSDRVLAHLQHEIVEDIAKYLWSTRRERCWK